MNCARHRDATHLIDTYLAALGSFPSLIAFASRKVEHALNTKAEALRETKYADSAHKSGPLLCDE